MLTALLQLQRQLQRQLQHQTKTMLQNKRHYYILCWQKNYKAMSDIGKAILLKRFFYLELAV